MQQHGTASNFDAYRWGRWSRRVLAALILCSACSGCVTPWEKSALLKETYPNIDRVQGPTERRMRGLLWNRHKDTKDESDSLKPLAGTDEYLAATELYKSEEYAEAQKAFKSVAKKFKKSEIREDALFMQGEAAFQQEHYSKAHDLYATLLKEYPSTRHLDVVSERLFKIGRLWLDFPEVAKLSEIQQVNYDDPKHRLPPEEPPKRNKTPIFVPNFTNKARPTFDTPGNGAAALQAIWMNDPTGPLADDAMMLVASHHARQGNYIEADRYFRMLRETFPNSPHLQDAFLIGSHVKLMSYQGADYDGKTLEDAEMLKESTLRLYPNIADSGRLKDELTKIQAAKAERQWQEVALWLRKGNKRAATVVCHQLISDFPKSTQAELARKQLNDMGPQYVSGAVLLTPHDPPKPPLWRRALGLPAVEEPVMQPVTQPKSAASPYANDQGGEQAPSRMMPNPFRKRTAPSADPIEGDSSESASGDDGSEAGGRVDLNEKDPSKKRSWRWPAPRRLPAEAEDDATKLEVSDTPGRSKL